MKNQTVGKEREKIFIDYVSHDKDWRGVVENELRCQEEWHKDWGFLADDKVSENPLTKEDRIHIIEEKLKAMKDVKLCSDFKDSFKGGNMDFQIKDYNRTKTIDLMPQSRRPKAISKAYAHLVEQGLEPELPKKK